MFKQTAIGLICFLAGLFGGMAAIGHTQTLRFEATAGLTKHRLAPEGSWHYAGFDTDTKLVVGSYAAGILWTPIKRGDWLIGARGGYSNLGTVRGSNSFPIFEDRSTLDARLNPVCNRNTLGGCTGKFDGSGKTSGWYFGPAIERNFGGGVALGAEIGAYVYKSAWTVGNVRAVDNDGSEFIPPVWKDFSWDLARGTHATSYLGANARWHELFVTVRRYSLVHASRAEENPTFIGMTSGPIWSVMAGMSIPL